MRILDIEKYGPAFPYFEFGKFNEIEKEYYIYHIPRFELILRLVSDLLIKRNELNDGKTRNLKILDIGPHFLTEILRNRTQAKVDQLGWRYDFVTKPRNDELHIEFDLNDCINESKWPAIEKYDIVVACEVLEHVYTSFDFIFPFLKTAVKDSGFLLIGTPNAVSLKRRLVMLSGRNPFDRITTEIYDPNHFREYTKKEMVEIVSGFGFKLNTFICMSNYNYINHGFIGKTYKLISSFLPYSLKDNMTFVFQKFERL